MRVGLLDLLGNHFTSNLQQRPAATTLLALQMVEAQESPVEYPFCMMMTEAALSVVIMTCLPANLMGSSISVQRNPRASRDVDLE